MCRRASTARPRAPRASRTAPKCCCRRAPTIHEVSSSSRLAMDPPECLSALTCSMRMTLRADQTVDVTFLAAPATPTPIPTPTLTLTATLTPTATVTPTVDPTLFGTVVPTVVGTPRQPRPRPQRCRGHPVHQQRPNRGPRARTEWHARNTRPVDAGRDQRAIAVTDRWDAGDNPDADGTPIRLGRRRPNQRPSRGALQPRRPRRAWRANSGRDGAPGTGVASATDGGPTNGGATISHGGPTPTTSRAATADYPTCASGDVGPATTAATEPAPPAEPPGPPTPRCQRRRSPSCLAPTPSPPPNLSDDAVPDLVIALDKPEVQVTRGQPSELQVNIENIGAVLRSIRNRSDRLRPNLVQARPTARSACSRATGAVCPSPSIHRRACRAASTHPHQGERARRRRRAGRRLCPGHRR